MDRLPNTRQPRKALYLTYALISLIVKLPYYVLESLLWPPMPSWSFNKAIHIRLLKWFIGVNNQSVSLDSVFPLLNLILQGWRSDSTL
jgi:hypothetical protein